MGYWRCSLTPPLSGRPPPLSGRSESAGNAADRFLRRESFGLPRLSQSAPGCDSAHQPTGEYPRAPVHATPPSPTAPKECAALRVPPTRLHANGRLGFRHYYACTHACAAAAADPSPARTIRPSLPAVCRIVLFCCLSCSCQRSCRSWRTTSALSESHLERFLLTTLARLRGTRPAQHCVQSDAKRTSSSIRA